MRISSLSISSIDIRINPLLISSIDGGAPPGGNRFVIDKLGLVTTSRLEVLDRLEGCTSG